MTRIVEPDPRDLCSGCLSGEHLAEAVVQRPDSLLGGNTI